LCRPDDPLHGGFFDSLGLGAGGSPPLLAADVDGALDDVLAAPLLLAAPGGVPEEDFDVDMFFADGAPDDDSGGLSSGASSNIMSSHAAVPLALPAASGQLADPCGTPDGASAPAGFTAPPVPARDVLDIVAAPDTTKPPLPAHDAVPAKTPTTPSTPSGCVSPVTSCETEAAASPASLSPLLPAWSAPRRKRHRPVTHRNPSWLPKSRLDSDSPPPALRATAASLEPVRRRNRQRQRACSNTETPQWRAGPRGPARSATPAASGTSRTARCSRPTAPAPAPASTAASTPTATGRSSSSWRSTGRSCSGSSWPRLSHRRGRRRRGVVRGRVYVRSDGIAASDIQSFLAFVIYH
jgi:hypothetical protein